LEERFQQDLEGAKVKYTKTDGQINQETTNFLAQPIDNLINMLIKIYGSGHYDLDIWKITAHLQEEVGEVALEILKLTELKWLKDHNHTFKTVVEKAVQRKIGEGMTIGPSIRAEIERLKNDDDALFRLFQESTVAKLKEELADVFTWISAILHKIGEERRTNLQVKEEYYLWKLLSYHCVTQARTPICRACGSQECERDCLVTTLTGGILDEMSRRS